MCLTITKPTSNYTIGYKAYKINSVNTDDSFNFEAPFQNGQYRGIRRDSTIHSDRKAKKPLKSEYQDREIEHGLHMLCDFDKALQVAKDRHEYNGCRYAVVRFAVPNEDVVARGTWGTDSSQYGFVCRSAKVNKVMTTMTANGKITLL